MLAFQKLLHLAKLEVQQFLIRLTLGLVQVQEIPGHGALHCINVFWHNIRVRKGEHLMPFLNGFKGTCCPPAQINKEKICGNFNNNSDEQLLTEPWAAPLGDYIQGNLQVFNSAVSVGNITGSVGVLGTQNSFGPVRPGNTFSRTFGNPNNLRLAIPPRTSGTYCLTLYKRVLA
jgi:hypothetical protein